MWTRVVDKKVILMVATLYNMDGSVNVIKLPEYSLYCWTMFTVNETIIFHTSCLCVHKLNGLLDPLDPVESSDTK